MASQARFIQSHPNFLLNFIDGIFEAFGHCMATQGLHVETVGLGGEDQKGHNRFVRFTNINKNEVQIVVPTSKKSQVKMIEIDDFTFLFVSF